MTIAAAILLASTFKLEWNPTYPTDVPCEVELDPGKLGASAFVVSADGRTLDTRLLRGKAPGTVITRFKVPAGAKKLSCSTLDAKGRLEDSKTLDNLFTGAVEPGNRANWSVPDGVEVSCADGGLLFCGKKPVIRTVSYVVDVPKGLAGRPVVQEIDVESKSGLCWSGKIRIVQLDAEGHELPESVADPRWTTHMRPPNKPVRYFEHGRLHPKAARLRAEFVLRPARLGYDEYGMRMADNAKCLPKLLLTRLAVRPAVRLPFPKWDDACFAEGVSGKPGDFALASGGADEKALFFQTHSRGCWAESHQFRREDELFFPAGAGTVEAWFKPNWKDVPPKGEVPLFEACNALKAEQMIPGIGTVLWLGYEPGAGRFRLCLTDWKKHSYRKDSEKVAFPDGQWGHVAVQWRPHGEAQVYLNGAAVMSLPIPDFEAVPLADESVKFVNDAWAMECYIGSTWSDTRNRKGFVKKDHPIFEGAIDLFRASTGLRYGGSFRPSRVFRVDRDTRALFTFDRVFDGVSGGGFGSIPGSYFRSRDRVDHRLATDRGTLQYYPAENGADNDPREVMDTLNYPHVPLPKGYLEATKTLVRRLKSVEGKRFEIVAGDVAYPEYVEFENASDTAQLRYPALVGDGRFDPRSFGDLARTFDRQGLSDREKVNRIFQYAISASDYFMNHQIDVSAGTDSPYCVCGNAMVTLNSYCGFECGPLNTLTANMLAAVAGCPTCQTLGYGHCFQQVFFDGKNHIYDLSYQKFFPSMDNETSVYLEEASDQPAVFNRVDSRSDHFIRRSTRPTIVEDVSYQEKFGLVLNPGEKVRFWYANDGQMNNLQTKRALTLDQYDFAETAGLKVSKGLVVRMDRIFPEYSTAVISRGGEIAPGNPALEKVAADSFCYRVRSCYPIVWGRYAAFDRSGKAVEIDWSTDSGKTFRPLPRGVGGAYSLEYLVKGRHDYLLRVKAPLNDVKDLSLRTEGIVNPRTFPGWVRPGRNAFEYGSVNGGKANVTIAWREPTKEIVVEGGAYQGTIPGQERQVVLVDPAREGVFSVRGVSDKAVVRTFGRVAGRIRGGRLRIGYDAGRPEAIARGDDLNGWYAAKGPDVPERREFPTVAGLEIRDGESVKYLTVIVSPDARLVTADGMSGGRPLPADADSVQARVLLRNKSDRVTANYPALPPGNYEVFALARYASHPKDVVSILLADPDGKAKPYVISQPINACEEFLKAQYGGKGTRSRWKWDTMNLLGEKYGQRSYCGWVIRTVSFPGTDKLELFLGGDTSEGVELAAVLILPDPDLECRNDLRKILFGLNCNPFR